MMVRLVWILLMPLWALLPGSGIALSATPAPTRPVVDIVAVSVRYLVITQAFEERTNRMATQLGAARTLAEKRIVYSEAAAAEHEMNGELLHLPLFPTPLRTDWKHLLMANRHLEDLYLELSSAGTVTDFQGLEALLLSARSEQLAADNALRRDLLLPPTSGALGA